MTVEELIVYGKKYTSSSHAKMLLADLLKKNTLELLTILNQEVEEDIEKMYKKMIIALKEGQPLQYVIGNVSFYGAKFKVDPRVLIPRFESEELCEKTLAYMNQKEKYPYRVLDLGTGSGVLGLTLKRLYPWCEVTLVDISSSALELAKENAASLNLEATFILSDWLANIPLQKFDIVISNPPYLKENEKIDEIVKNNEPHLALYGGKDGLDCYKKIFSKLPLYLNNFYFLAFEIGCDQKEALLKLAEQNFQLASCFVEKDLQSRNRMLFVKSKYD